MIPIPFIIGAAIGSGATLYFKRKNKEKTILTTLNDSMKLGTKTVSEAVVTGIDTVKSTVEVVKEKNQEKKEFREQKTETNERKESQEVQNNDEKQS